MIHKEFFGLLFLGFIAWIFIAATPAKRIENLCRPVGWTGNVTVSMSALIVPSHQVKVQSWFDRLEYGCQFITWRMFYQKDYNSWLASQGKAPVGAESKPLFDLGIPGEESAHGEEPVTSPFGSETTPYVAPNSDVEQQVAPIETLDNSRTQPIEVN